MGVETKTTECCLYSVCGMENCSVGYDSVLRFSVWEYRDRYKDQIFLISACAYRIILLLNIWIVILLE